MKSTDILAGELRELVAARGVSVQTVGVGNENNEPVLIVYVGNRQRASNIPKVFNGVHVKVVRVGVIRPARHVHA